MSRGFRVETRGVNQLRKRLRELSSEVRDGAIAAVTEAGDSVAKDMENNVPVDQGDLRSSISSEVNRGNLVAEVGPRGSDVYYGYFQEFGTANMPANPFAQPAYEAERKRFPGRMRKHVGKRLR
ncbi:HK97-gp10 family putative phage morphogenesis protein [Nocardiopsis alba]|uniref:HK97-gp10 family putative phage morphogenesis protein n=1 Tax=Nocardiopsis alba TaxID=53437 RepID=UPI00380F2187